MASDYHSEYETGCSSSSVVEKHRRVTWRNRVHRRRSKEKNMPSLHPGESTPRKTNVTTWSYYKNGRSTLCRPTHGTKTDSLLLGSQYFKQKT